MAWGQAFSQPAACQVVDLGVQGQRVQAGGMGAGTTSFSPYPQLSSSDCPQMLQTEEDDLEFWILWPPASESPPSERIKEGFAG